MIADSDFNQAPWKPCERCGGPTPCDCQTVHFHHFTPTGTAMGVPASDGRAPTIRGYACQCGEKISVIANIGMDLAAIEGTLSHWEKK